MPTDIQQINIPTRPLTLHKPTPSQSGSAAKFNVRMVEHLGVSEGAHFWKKTKGGLFVDLAKQIGQDDHGNATFGWQQEQGVITAKLGLPDLSALLLGYREVRLLGRAVPPDVRPQAREQDTDDQRKRKAATVSLFHRAEGKAGGATSAITYEFTAQGGSFRVSKSKDVARSLSVSLAEELRLFKFFDMSLEYLLKAGAR